MTREQFIRDTALQFLTAKAEHAPELAETEAHRFAVEAKQLAVGLADEAEAQDVAPWQGNE